MTEDIRSRWLYHFTSVDNLPGIMASGLIADAGRPATVTECADPSIKQRRRENIVLIPPGGVVADYAPFYFASRSPMLYRISQGGVKTYQGSQGDLVYLLTRIHAIEAMRLPWVATQRNAAVKPNRFTNEVHKLATLVDWDLMKAVYWRNTPEDGSRVQRRMAEFLVHRRVPWEAISHVAVRSETMARRVEDLLAGQSHTPVVVVRPGWYY